MIIWVDAQLPPTLAAWLVETFGVTTFSLKELGLRDAKDTEIFEAARQPNLVIMTISQIKATNHASSYQSPITARNGYQSRESR